MSYATIVTMQHSSTLLNRCAASAAQEVSNAGEDARLASVWAQQRSWDLASTPGWAAAWESAEVSGIVDPGSHEATITDAMILSRVQPLLVDFPMSDLTGTPAPPPV